MTGPLLTKREAAEQLNISLRILNKEIRSGRIPVKRVGDRLRIRPEDLDSYRNDVIYLSALQKARGVSRTTRHIQKAIALGTCDNLDLAAAITGPITLEKGRKSRKPRKPKKKGKPPVIDTDVERARIVKAFKESSDPVSRDLYDQAQMFRPPAPKAEKSFPDTYFAVNGRGYRLPMSEMDRTGNPVMRQLYEQAVHSDQGFGLTYQASAPFSEMNSGSGAYRW